MASMRMLWVVVFWLLSLVLQFPHCHGACQHEYWASQLGQSSRADSTGHPPATLGPGQSQLTKSFPHKSGEDLLALSQQAPATGRLLSWLQGIHGYLLQHDPRYMATAGSARNCAAAVRTYCRNCANPTGLALTDCTRCGSGRPLHNRQPCCFWILLPHCCTTEGRTESPRKPQLRTRWLRRLPCRARTGRHYPVQLAPLFGTWCCSCRHSSLPGHTNQAQRSLHGAPSGPPEVQEPSEPSVSLTSTLCSWLCVHDRAFSYSTRGSCSTSSPPKRWNTQAPGRAAASTCHAPLIQEPTRKARSSLIASVSRCKICLALSLYLGGYTSYISTYQWVPQDPLSHKEWSSLPTPLSVPVCGRPHPSTFTGSSLKGGYTSGPITPIPQMDPTRLMSVSASKLSCYSCTGSLRSWIACLQSAIAAPHMSVHMTSPLNVQDFSCRVIPAILAHSLLEETTSQALHLVQRVTPPTALHHGAGWC